MSVGDDPENSLMLTDKVTKLLIPAVPLSPLLLMISKTSHDSFHPPIHLN